MKSLKNYLFLFLIILVSACGSSVSDDPEDDSNKFLAYTYAENYVEQKLKSPDSAKYPDSREKLSQIKHLGNFRYEIRSWVSSQNSFGAQLKQSFVCVIRIDNEAKMNYLEKLDFIK